MSSFASHRMSLWWRTGSKMMSKHSWAPFRRPRPLHTYSKRPQINYGVSSFQSARSGNRWNVYDDLKLLSYGSHLIFFMMLPPVVKLMMTQVDVTRDETLTDSAAYFEQNTAQVRRAFPCSPSIDTRLVDIYSRAKSDEVQRKLDAKVKQLREIVQQQMEKSKSKSKEIATTSFAYKPDNMVKAYVDTLTGLYQQYKLGNIDASQYSSNLLCVLSRMRKDGLSKRALNKLLKLAVQQVHTLGLYTLEDALVFSTIRDTGRHTLTARRRAIAARFERRKTHTYSSQTHLAKAMKNSGWLQYILGDSSMVLQLSQLAALTEKSKKYMKTILDMAFSGDRNNKDTLVSVFDVMVQYNRKEDAQMVLRRIEKLHGSDRKLMSQLRSKMSKL